MVRLDFIIKNKINIILELLFPSKCLGCNISGEILCQNCINKLEPAERETERNIIASYDYRDPIIKKAIWKLKYYGSPYLGERLGQLLYADLVEDVALLQMFSQGSPILVIPVPISKDRKKGRGYNQSEVIARSFCNSAERNVFELKNNLVTKIINTLPQARLTNRNKRLKNIKGAFKITDEERIKDRTVIVIDDVTTTGGTITEIMKILKKSGAKKVIGFAVAH